MDYDYKIAPFVDLDVKRFSLRGLEKSFRVVRDIALMYLPFHGVSPEECWTRLDVLIAAESLIYEADDAAEAGTMPVDYVTPYLREAGVAVFEWQKMVAQGLRYYTYELRFQRGDTLDESKIADALHCRSTDYQILHRVACGLFQRPFSAAVETQMSSIDTIREIEYDLHHFEKDVKANSYNMYRALIRLLGPQEASQRLKGLLDAAYAEAAMKAEADPHFARALSVYRTFYPAAPGIPVP